MIIICSHIPTYRSICIVISVLRQTIRVDGFILYRISALKHTQSMVQCHGAPIRQYHRPKSVCCQKGSFLIPTHRRYAIHSPGQMLGWKPLATFIVLTYPQKTINGAPVQHID